MFNLQKTMIFQVDFLIMEDKYLILEDKNLVMNWIFKFLMQLKITVLNLNEYILEMFKLLEENMVLLLFIDVKKDFME